jgi:hypothetical protein
MKHVYSIYDISPDNTEHNTGKTIEIEEPVFNSDGALDSSREGIVRPLLATYGFERYGGSFAVRAGSNKNKMVLTYGGVPTWVLKRGR